MKKTIVFLSFLCMGCCAFAQAEGEEQPVVIEAPDTVINKTAYSLTSGSVTVAVTNGSAYPAEHDWNNIDVTYFACLAGEDMTISASEPIKGVAVNGWVKKSFSASANHGVLQYLSDDYDDTVGEPVLTISDVDNTSVTIHCNNQLRCFSVEVYFSQNPNGVQTEVTDTVRLTALTAGAQDYSADADYSYERHYSYWLHLEPEGTYPQIWLDMYAAEKGDLSGSYALDKGNVGDYSYVQLSDDSWDYEYAYDQQFVITPAADGYHIEGWIVAENEVRYEFVYDGLVALESLNEAIPYTSSSVTGNPSPRKYLRGGMIVIERGGRVYNLLGTEAER